MAEIYKEYFEINQLMKKFSTIINNQWDVDRINFFFESGLLKGFYPNGSKTNLMISEKSFVALIHHQKSIEKQSENIFVNSSEINSLVNHENQILNHLDELGEILINHEDNSKLVGIYHNISMITKDKNQQFGQTTERFQEVLHSIIDLSFGEYFETIDDPHPDNFLNFSFESLNLMIDELYDDIIPKKMLREIFDSIPNFLVVMVGEHGEINFISKSVEFLISIRSGQLIDKNIKQLIRNYEAIKDKFDSGSNQIIEVELIDDLSKDKVCINLISHHIYQTNDNKIGAEILIFEQQWKNIKDQESLRADTKNLNLKNATLIKRIEVLRNGTN